MLTKFTLADFKSYREATLDLSPLTLLIGANASGKSNALEALQMLSWLSRGRRLDDIFRSVEESELAMRGSISDLTCDAAGDFSLGCQLEDEAIWELKIRIQAGQSGMRLMDEQVEGHGESLPLYKAHQTYPSPSNSLLVSYNNFSKGRNKPKILCTDQQAVFTQLLTPARFGAKHRLSQETIPKVAMAFVKALEQILFLDPQPRRMRGYSFLVDKILKNDGSNLSSLLFDLCTNQQRKGQVLEFIRDLPEQDITDIEFLKGPREEVMVQLEESFGNKQRLREAAVLSDGTLRVVAVAAAVLSSSEGSIVVVEEIDNGVHPSRARTLLANLEKVARDRKLSVLLTSHNPALLDALPVSAIPNVVFCYRDPHQGDSRLVKLSQLPDYPELVAQGPLGRLVTQGILDRFVKTAKKPEEKVQAALDWIEDLERAPVTP